MAMWHDGHMDMKAYREDNPDYAARNRALNAARAAAWRELARLHRVEYTEIFERIKRERGLV